MVRRFVRISVVLSVRVVGLVLLIVLVGWCSKTSLKLAVARMKLLKNKRDIQLKQMKRDLAQLLDSGQEQTARIRVCGFSRRQSIKMSFFSYYKRICCIVAKSPYLMELIVDGDT